MSNKAGFSLIEIIIAIVLIGLIGVLFLGPRLQPVSREYQRKQFVEQLNQMMQIGLRSALRLGALHRVLFDIRNQQVNLERQVADRVKTGREAHKGFAPIEQEYTGTTLHIPDGYEIEHFYIEGNRDEIRATGTTDDVWFYIAPDGLTQSVVINMVDRSEPDEPELEFSLALNPYYATFTLHDQFVQP